MNATYTLKNEFTENLKIYSFQNEYENRAVKDVETRIDCLLKCGRKNMNLDEFDAMMSAQDGNLLDLTGGNPYQMNQQFNPYQTTPQPMTIY